MLLTQLLRSLATRPLAGCRTLVCRGVQCVVAFDSAIARSRPTGSQRSCCFWQPGFVLVGEEYPFRSVVYIAGTNISLCRGTNTLGWNRKTSGSMAQVESHGSSFDNEIRWQHSLAVGCCLYAHALIRSARSAATIRAWCHTLVWRDFSMPLFETS